MCKWAKTGTFLYCNSTKERFNWKMFWEMVEKWIKEKNITNFNKLKQWLYPFDWSSWPCSLWGRSILAFNWPSTRRHHAQIIALAICSAFWRHYFSLSGNSFPSFPTINLGNLQNFIKSIRKLFANLNFTVTFEVSEFWILLHYLRFGAVVNEKSVCGIRIPSRSLCALLNAINFIWTSTNGFGIEMGNRIQISFIFSAKPPYCTFFFDLLIVRKTIFFLYTRNCYS